VRPVPVLRRRALQQGIMAAAGIGGGLFAGLRFAGVMLRLLRR